MKFEVGDEVRIVRPYTINGDNLRVHDDATIVKVGETGVVIEARANILLVGWGDHPELGSRRIDKSCLELVGPSDDEVAAAIASILETSSEQ